MDELLNYVSELINYIEAIGSNLNEETQRELGIFLEEVMQFINEQMQEPIDKLSPSLPEPELQQSMPSSNIYAFGYDPESSRLLVKFQGNDGVGHGPVYGYRGVPKVIFDLFKNGSIPARTTGKNRWGKWWKGKVPSIGASMYTLIKNGNYPYQRLQ
jgi:hypothetical protein